MDLTARTAEQIGETLRRTRKARGWTQSDISARTNLRVATILSLENGDAGAKLATVLAVMAIREHVAARVRAGGIDAWHMHEKNGRDCVGALQFVSGEIPEVGAL